MEFDLRSLRSDSAVIVQRLLAEFRPGGPRDELVRVGEELALRFHILAVGALLVEGDAQKFFLHLGRCAENGLRLLRLLAHRGLERPPASHDVPLLAALAATDFGRAAAIAELSRDARDLRSGEYEDEFLWARALQLVGRGAARSDLQPVLDRLVALDAAGYGSRAGAAASIVAADGEGFEAAMAAAAQEHEARTEARAAAFGTPVTTFAPHRFLWLEGLALLRLGERAGLRVEADLRSCPRLARGPVTARYEGDLAIAVGPAGAP